jgi:glucosamine-6-phosphate deaminase
MNFITVDSYEKLSEMAAEIICNQVINKPESILGLATGSSPVGTYKKMAEANKEGKVDFSKVISVNLDEYVGLTGSKLWYDTGVYRKTSGSVCT